MGQQQSKSEIYVLKINYSPSFENLVNVMKSSMILLPSKILIKLSMIDCESLFSEMVYISQDQYSKHLIIKT